MSAEAVLNTGEPALSWRYRPRERQFRHGDTVRDAAQESPTGSG
jgi:hypothetical protein